jgi:hypothetical protein
MNLSPIHNESVIFVVISIFAVTFTYSSFTPFVVYAVPPDSHFDPAVQNCTKKVYTNLIQQTCCWEEKSPGSNSKVTYCQTCYTPTGPGIVTCDPKQKQAPLPGNLQDLPTLEPATPPHFGKKPGGAEQPLTQAPQLTSNDSGTTEGDSSTQPRTPKTVTPEITKDDDNEEGGLPTIERNEDP